MVFVLSRHGNGLALVPAQRLDRQPCPELAGISVAGDAAPRLCQLVCDFVAQKRGTHDEGGPDEREQQHILDRRNAALIVPELG